MSAPSKNTEKIVTAAVKLFRSGDYESVMVKDICREAGVSRSSFYSAFSGKDEVLMHILRGHRDDFEETMLRLLHAESPLEKLWILFTKYLNMSEEFGPELMAALFQLTVTGKFDLLSAVNGYVERYHSWFVRFVQDCQREGIIRNPGKAEELVPMGVRLTFFAAYEWCAAKCSYSLRDRAFQEIETFYNVAPEHRGLRPE